jgi:hypothetical protein
MKMIRTGTHTVISRPQYASIEGILHAALASIFFIEFADVPSL